MKKLKVRNPFAIASNSKKAGVVGPTKKQKKKQNRVISKELEKEREK